MPAKTATGRAAAQKPKPASAGKAVPKAAPAGAGKPDAKAPPKKASPKVEARRAPAAKAPARKPAPVKPAARPPAPVKARKPESSKPAPGKAAAKKAVAKPAPGKKAAAKKAPPKAAPRKAAPKPEAVKTAKPAVRKPEPTKAAAAEKASKKPAARETKAEPKKEARPTPPPPSPFAVGDKVVYPHHGAAVIARKERVEFQGQRTDYFVLEVATDQLILKVPVRTAVERGVRPVISKVVARKVLATFKEPPEEAGANWSRWYKLLTEKINSGDIFQVAEVVRDLTFAQQTKGISPALKRMLSKARLILASELRFALDVTEEEAMRRLDKSLPRVEVAGEF
jgi:CarD family transcriptional regulator